MRIEELVWRGRPAQDLTKEELQVAFVELTELYEYERNRN